MEITQPTIDWYREKSRNNGICPRCPYANMNTCPRYYFSWALLGEFGITTQLDEIDDKKLLAKWKKSPLYPNLGEQDTSISGWNGKMSSISNACPEVTYDVFGLFASFLSKYSDEIDLSAAQKCLENEAADRNDWRWEWQFVHPAHYFDCHLYSQINSNQKNTVGQGLEREIIELKPGIFGLTINLKAFYKWFRKKCINK